MSPGDSKTWGRYTSLYTVATCILALTPDVTPAGAADSELRGSATP